MIGKKSAVTELPPSSLKTRRPTGMCAQCHRAAPLPGPTGKKARPPNVPVRKRTHGCARGAGPVSCHRMTDCGALCKVTSGRQSAVTQQLPKPRQIQLNSSLVTKRHTCPCTNRGELGPSPALGGDREPRSFTGWRVQSESMCYTDRDSHHHKE